MSFERLFQPGNIAGMRLKNRLVMSPMATVMASTTGEVTQRMIEYYRARARGGVGMVIIELTLADLKLGDGLRPLIRTLDMANFSHSAQLNELVEAVHDYGAKIAIQLSAGGGKSVTFDTAPGAQPISCSPIPFDFAPDITPREMTIQEIEYLTDAQGKAASLIKGAGADAIELHGHGAYLMAQFMSPRTNHRTDRYGGNTENRFRFTLETIQAIKAYVGNDFPLILRYSVDEFIEGGRGLEESKVMAKLAEKAGVHALDVSAGVHAMGECAAWFIPPSYLPKAAWVHMAAEMKKTVKIPIIVAGRLGDPDMAEKVLEEGKADFISMGRPLICDPDLPNKVAEGRIEDIRRCISCNEGCLVPPGEGRYLRCVLNPLAGRELNYKEPAKAEKKKKVMVIGGGPGGMEAARIAGLRGHNVILYEKNKQLGGSQLRSAMVPPHKEDLANIIKYYETQFKKMDNVTLKLGVEVTAKTVKDEKPDAAIIATGSEPIIPPIPGVDSANVVTAQAVLTGQAKVGKNVVIVGFGMVGCETADFLSEQGKNVTLVDMRDESEVAVDVGFLSRICLLGNITKKSVTIVGSRPVTSITTEGVNVKDPQGNMELLKADTVVLAVGSKSMAGLEPQITSLVKESYIIGDALQPRKIRQAVWEGFRCCYEL